MITSSIVSRSSSKIATQVLLLLFVFIFAITLVGIKPVMQAQAASYAWEAYNDCVVTGSPANPANTTAIVCYNNNTSGTLKNFSTGASLGVTATVTTSGSVGVQDTSDYQGSIPNAGTDAYDLFNGKANIVGGIRMYNSSSSSVTLTITNLDPTKTYTFATTANRNNTSYTGRITRFTLSDVVSATNASSTGTTMNGLYTEFVTGYNTTNGYIARWENIVPDTDGDFVVTFTNVGTETTAYGPAVFYLAEEIVSDVEIESVAVSDIDVPAALAIPDTSASVAADPVLGITSTTAAVTWDPNVNPFDYSTVYTASVTLTAASGYKFTSGTTATVNGQTAVVVLNGDGTLTVSFTFPKTADVPLTAITSVAVSDIIAPVALDTPDILATIAATPVSGITSSTAAVTWQAPDNPFDYSTVYTASVTLTAASGYEFTSGTTATVNGQAAVVVLNGDGTLTVSYAFPMTGAEPVIYYLYLPLILK